MIGVKNFGGNITNTHVSFGTSGTVTGTGNVGGLIGWNQGGDGVSGSYVSKATVSAGGGSNVGGLVGWNGWWSNGASISTSYVSGGSVSGGLTIGGLVGRNDGGLSALAR